MVTVSLVLYCVGDKSHLRHPHFLVLRRRWLKPRRRDLASCCVSFSSWLGAEDYRPAVCEGIVKSCSEFNKALSDGTTPSSFLKKKLSSWLILFCRLTRDSPSKTATVFLPCRQRRICIVLSPPIVPLWVKFILILSYPAQSLRSAQHLSLRGRQRKPAHFWR